MVTCRQLEGSLRRRFGPQLREASHWEGGCSFYLRNPRTRAFHIAQGGDPRPEVIDPWTDVDVLYPCDWGKLTYLGPKICAHIPVPAPEWEAFLRDLERTSCKLAAVYQHTGIDRPDVVTPHIECPDYGRKGLLSLIEKQTRKK